MVGVGAAPNGAKEVAVGVAREAGALLRERLGRVEVEFKGVVDLVTEADRAAEALIAARIADAFPDHQLIGEEGIAREAGGRGEGGFRWVVDPLDGTTNFAHAYPHFAVSIALLDADGIALGVVYDPMRDELFLAERGGGATLNGRPIRVSTTDALIRSLLATGFSYDLSERDEQLRVWSALQATVQGIRRDGSAALNLCYVAAGRLDGFWEDPLQPWDIAAGALLVREAGGTVTAIDGGPFDPLGHEVVATNGHLHEAIREVVAAAHETADAGA